MRISFLPLALAACFAAPSAAPGQAQSGDRIRAVLPAEGLVGSSVVAVRNQADLNAHYYLADEDVLGLGRGSDAVLARYRAGDREALVLAVAYPSEKDAGKVFERFGRDFFSKDFVTGSRRFLEKLETGDWAGTVRQGPCLIVVLEAPDRKSCDNLLRRAEERASERF